MFCDFTHRLRPHCAVVPMLLLLFLLVPLLHLPCVQSVAQRRPVRITPFLYSDALNIAAAGGPLSSATGDAGAGAIVGVPAKFVWGGQSMRQITPFLYSSVNRRGE